MSKCAYCGYSNDAGQRYCGEGAPHGCGAPLDTAEETGWGIFAPLGNLLIYYDNPDLQDLQMREDFNPVLNGALWLG